MTKPLLKPSLIWNMCFGIMGIQFGFALMNANVSRIFQTLGADVGQISILWIAAPLTGLLVQPLIGYYSDRSWTRWGRRRPFIVAAAVLAAIGLLVMPWSPHFWVAAGVLWIMDTSMNATQEPFRAFMGDNLPNSQKTLGFAVQSFFVGIGAVAAAALPWLLANGFDMNNTAPSGVIPDTVKAAFVAGSAIYLATVLWSVVSTKEYSPEQRQAFEDGRAGSESSDAHAGPRQVAHDFLHMPLAMRQLAVVQFCAWFGMITLWIYGVPAVTSWHFGSSDVTSEIYNRGANWMGVLIAAYNGVAAAYALTIPWLVRHIGSRRSHCIHMLLGGVGLASFFWIRDPQWLIGCVLFVGIAWASILSIPYSMLSAIVPQRKMGTYMGLFNYFVVIPQVLAALLMGWVVKNWFGGDAIYALVIAGIALALSGLAALRVDARAELQRA